MSWPLVPLSDAALIQMGTAPPGSSYNEASEGVPMIAGAGDYGEKYPLPKKWTTQPTRMTNEGDLIVCVRATIGDLNWADKKYCLGRGVAGVRAKRNVADLGYLAHVIASKKRELTKLGTGSTFLAIRRDDLKGLQIPLPPLKEQKRIAAILDKADAIRRKRQQAIELADQFLRSVFLDMFGDPVTNPKGWLKKKISEIGDVATGNTPSRKIEAYYGGYIEWIKSDNINTPNHILTEASEYLSEEGTKVARIVTAGSILVTCIAGSMDCIGNIALSNRRVAFNQQINSITPFEADQLRFIYAQLLYNKNLVQEASTKSMKGMVSKSKFSDIELIVPDKKSCQKFSQLFAETNNWTDKLTVQLTISNSIFDALAQQAFSGELSEAKAA